MCLGAKISYYQNFGENCAISLALFSMLNVTQSYAGQGLVIASHIFTIIMGAGSRGAGL